MGFCDTYDSLVGFTGSAVYILLFACWKSPYGCYCLWTGYGVMNEETEFPGDKKPPNCS